VRRGPFEVLIEIGRAPSHLAGILDDGVVHRLPLAFLDRRLDHLASQGRGPPTGQGLALGADAFDRAPFR
jgi:hypothetical protein